MTIFFLPLQNGCLVVQNLIELYPHNGDFSHQFLEEVLGGITQVAANSHGSFVLHKLLIHPDLRSQTLLAVFSSLDPLCAGPDVGRDALLEGAHLGCSSEEWGEWVGKVCDG
ncbi:hypothetical protein BDY24DRAFT_156882 [Mrakia frigida]|uniref:uncharacterized protein n=1 Tax=Mrakia frigida TaxID=29902 RepID=UPI003FCC0347